jgi:rhodanese-related sulfurtransferase
LAAWVAAVNELPLHIDVRSVQELRECGEVFLLLDCREADEYALVRIEGSMHLPMNEIPARLDALAPFCPSRIVVLCHHGVRSLRVTQWLREQGFGQTQNMTGGIDAWSLLIDTSLPRY